MFKKGDTLKCTEPGNTGLHLNEVYLCEEDQKDERWCKIDTFSGPQSYLAFRFEKVNSDAPEFKEGDTLTCMPEEAKLEDFNEQVNVGFYKFIRKVKTVLKVSVTMFLLLCMGILPLSVQLLYVWLQPTIQQFDLIDGGGRNSFSPSLVVLVMFLEFICVYTIAVIWNNDLWKE
jgi:hypothetical protein